MLIALVSVCWKGCGWCWRRRGLPVFPLFGVADAAFATVLVLWAGPDPHDAHNLGPIERGYALLATAVCQTVCGLPSVA